ncbi:hypothetical protein POM88_010242 [Heracleum sosnowskyi]|uniref:Uncharacterized protein n=1 Tax=Heracleum sosnowskyi TaxID=360622 RepID=A0AAD8JBF6_9APIA|nr:hypothetical protein POM88_010242 [Heracleum sosnowskyi]
MEKSGIKSKNRLLKLASSAVSFQNPPYSPNREKAQARKGFSGPMFPAESRYKSKNSSYISHEPTSPKVSCMGQIKHKKKIRDLNKKKANDHASLPPRHDHFISHSTPLEQVNPSKNQKPKLFKSFHSFTEVKKKNPAPVLEPVHSSSHEDAEKKKKKNSGIRSIFGKPSKRNEYDQPPLTAPSDKKAPSLGQLQRFASSRNSLSNFDWTTAQISPAEEHDDESDGEWDEEDVKISFSAPLSLSSCSVANAEPRKEINLWKRRTMAQPKPLQLNT